MMSHTTSPRSLEVKEFTSEHSPPVQQSPRQTDKELVAERKRKDTGQFVLPPSPADSMLNTNQNSPTAFAAEGNRLMRDIDRGAPGDQAIFSDLKTPEQKQLAKRKSQHYNDAFANRESNSSARERVLRESTVMADVRTNVIVSGSRYIKCTKSNISVRSTTSTLLSPIFHTAFLAAINDPNPPYLSQCPILHACCLVAPSTLLTR